MIYIPDSVGFQNRGEGRDEFRACLGQVFVVKNDDQTSWMILCHRCRPWNSWLLIGCYWAFPWMEPIGSASIQPSMPARRVDNGRPVTEVETRKRHDWHDYMNLFLGPHKVIWQLLCVIMCYQQILKISRRSKQNRLPFSCCSLVMKSDAEFDVQ